MASHENQRIISSTRRPSFLGQRIGILALACSLSACIGTIGDLPSEEQQNGVIEPGTTIPFQSAYPRLTHAQWENTTRDLLKLDSSPGLTASFTSDPLGGIFDNDESVLQVTPPLWADYQRAAEELTAMILADPQMLARIVPADTGQTVEARGREFIAQFGKRAYRRPLTDPEIETHATLFASGATVLGGDAFLSGVQLVLEAFLQSPYFVYRVEQGTGKPRTDGLVPLRSHELATRLSYLLWNTMPDEALLDAAAAGELDTADGLRTRAEQMLLDPRAKDVVRAFHKQLFDWKKYADLYKDPVLFPEFVPEIGNDLRQEAELFVDRVIYEQNGGLRELLTSRTAFVNDRLASIYGVPAPAGAEFGQVELDASTRSGALTRLGFLAANGTARASDPIHRGVFVNLRILCTKLPPPPDNVTPLPSGVNKTTRDLVDSHTGEGTCGAGCHSTLINPAGFAFENFDAIGRVRTMDNGYPVNTAAQYALGGVMVQYADSVEWSQIIAESAEANRCFAKHWLEFALGRDAQPEDGTLLEKLGESSRGGSSVKELLVDIIVSDAFRARRPVEVP
ncbi:MAG TPA: DUF1592 domain-containing protein [Polyangium sp.]|nr:DUF1592 domain-containing protein [Polyangium sp.]